MLRREIHWQRWRPKRCHRKRRVVKVTLGEYLGSIRTDRKLTLRAVEEATNKEVSNAYLSQIENGKIQKPSQTSFMPSRTFTAWTTIN